VASKPGLYTNIHAKRARIKAGSGEKMRKPGAPTDKAFKQEKVMPLVKSASKNAFRKNVKTEMAAGKPQKQAVAIAYSTKRAAKKGKSSGCK